jgi:hypothetical protein
MESLTLGNDFCRTAVIEGLYPKLTTRLLRVLIFPHNENPLRKTKSFSRDFSKMEVKGLAKKPFDGCNGRLLASILI